MTKEETAQIIKVLSKLEESQWESILAEVPKAEMAIESSLRSLKEAVGKGPKGGGKVHLDILHVYGYRLLSDSQMGPLLREEILKAVPAAQWQKLKERYQELFGEKTLRACTSQTGKGTRIMAENWRTGSKWSLSFCELLRLPQSLAASHGEKFPLVEKINPVVTLKALHPYQEDVYQRLRGVLAEGQGAPALVSLPTGAGKTRVAVDAICDHLAETMAADPGGGRDIVLWIARTHELLQQAWESFRGVWQVPPMRRGGREPVRRSNPMKIVRAWQSADPFAVLEELKSSGAAGQVHVVVAGIDQLHSWLDGEAPIFRLLNSQSGRLCCCVVDEAHGVVTPQFSKVLEALGLKRRGRWLPSADAPALIGLTATPWRSADGTGKLSEFFQGGLLRPETLKNKPIRRLRADGILAEARYEKMPVVGTPGMTPKQMKKVEQFREIPADYLALLGRERSRNARILRRLIELPPDSKVLVFACSVEHANMLSLSLNRHFGSGSSSVVSGETPRALRVSMIDRFRNSPESRFLCNYGVLTTGFDAPRIDVVCITRPTLSALLYEQMVGRGLRGPKNGGTASCLILDVQDEGLPEGIQSYARVLDQWE